jgi:trimeric autotransporter adhesin
MSALRVDGAGGLGRVAVAAVAALASVALAGSGARAVTVPRTGLAEARQAGREVAAGTISTVAGGVGGPAKGTKVSLFVPGGLDGEGYGPCGVTYADGSLYAAASSTQGVGGGSVRKVNPQTGWLTTPAGNGSLGGELGLGGLAADTGIDTCGAAVDHSGNLVIADQGYQMILVVARKTGTFYGQAMTARHIYDVAGDGVPQFTGDGGPAVDASLDQPQDVTVDHAGNLVIADTANKRIRVVAARTGTFYGREMTGGDIYTVVARLDYPDGVAVDAAGNLVIADTDGSRVVVLARTSGTFYGQAMTIGHTYTVAGNGTYGFSGDGGPATSAELYTPTGVALDGAGNLLIGDGCRIRAVADSTATFYGQAMTTGDIYTIAGNGNCGFSGDGAPATTAELTGPEGVAVDGAGNLVLADFGNYRVRVVAERTGTFYGQAMATGDIYTIAGTGPGRFSGDGGPATSAELYDPGSVTADAAGNLVLADSGNDRVRVVAERAGTFYGQAMTAGRVYSVAGNGTSGYSGDGGPAASAEFAQPEGVAVDGAGNLLLADTYNWRVRMVAERAGTFYGQAMTAGDVYTVAGDGTAGFSGDGGPATAAEIAGVQNVAVDAAGNLLIADEGNQRVRVVAARTGTFYGQPMTTGDIYTVAGNGQFGFSGDGGPAASAAFRYPTAVAVDAAGNLLLADEGNQRVRVVAARTGTFYGQPMTTGDIYTVAGNGTGGSSGDDGPAVSAELNGPQGVVVDAAGNLLIADSYNSRVRVVAERTGTFYGQPMTTGDIYTVAGDGMRGSSGDGGPAPSAELNRPQEVAVDAAGNLLIADTYNDRIQTVTSAGG